MRTLLPALALLALPAAAAAQAPFTTDRCPVPPEVRGYPVSLAAADGAPLDSAFARAFVEEGLRRARFTPARADCRVIPRSVVQIFGERG